MILVIPSIQLINGECGDKISGTYEENELYKTFRKNPKQLIKLWRRENAKTIHINNIDSFQEKDNNKNLNLIAEFSKQTDIPISLLHNFKTVENCRKVLRSGIYRIFVGIVPLKEKEGIKELVKEYGMSRICGNILCDGSNAIIDEDKRTMPVINLLKAYKEVGIQRILYNSTFSLNTIRVDDILQISNINKEHKMRITVNGGAIAPNDLWRLNENATGGIDSIVIGSALYQNNFPCQQIWRMVEEELEPNIIKDNK